MVVSLHSTSIFSSLTEALSFFCCLSFREFCSITVLLLIHILMALTACFQQHSGFPAIAFPHFQSNDVELGQKSRKRSFSGQTEVCLEVARNQQVAQKGENVSPECSLLDTTVPRSFIDATKCSLRYLLHKALPRGVQVMDDRKRFNHTY